MALKPLGLAVTAGLILAPIIWLPGIAAGRDGIALFSQYLGMTALIAMATSQTIATRWLGVEALFGPLDLNGNFHAAGVVENHLGDTVFQQQAVPHLLRQFPQAVCKLYILYYSNTCVL